MNTQKIKNLKELKSFCEKFSQKLKSPGIVLLEGDLATGKTQMVKYLAESLGYKEEDVQSPTFSLINHYKAKGKPDIYHVDLYRLETEKEIESTGFWSLFDEEALIFIEWPKRVRGQLPKKWNKLQIELQFSKDPDSRILKWQSL